MQGDKWDDYTYNTLFHASLCTIDAQIRLGIVRLLVDGVKSAREALTDYAGYDIESFLETSPSLFISLGGDLDYYRTLTKLTDRNTCEFILLSLHDAAYLQVTDPNNQSLMLRNTEGFTKSLLRSLSERQAFEEAAQVLFGGARRENRSFTVSYDLRGEESRQTLSFDFGKSGTYPGNMNLLIGSNGTGKTQALKAIISALIDREFLSKKDSEGLKDLNATVSEQNMFSQLVAVSYSPFEDFPIAAQSNRAGAEQYQYCGFRTGNSISGDAILCAAPAQLSTLIVLDSKATFKDQTSRFATFISAMQVGLEFDELQRVSDNFPLPEVIWNKRNAGPTNFNLESTDRLVFVRDKKILKLSAGQTIFVALLLSVLQHIKKDALLLIDEPELYLHPNLEVQFVAMLRTLLHEFDAYAIIATHSMILAREIPKQRMWILRKTEDGTIDAFRPPFQTFGADLARLGNYVFDDAFVPHPYLLWLKGRIGQAESLGDIVEDDMSLELKMTLRSIQGD
ncbi:MAG: AAA family ATPase [Vulcanimicrobiaceae bacterium]